MVKRIVKKSLGLAGLSLFKTRDRYVQDGLMTVHNDHFRDDPAFKAAYARGVKAGNGVDPQFEWRVHIALWAAATAMGVPGDFIECGVNAGFISSAILYRLHWETVDRRFYLVDTFNGPVLAQYSPEEVERGRLKIAEDALSAGAYVTDLDRVRANYAEWPNTVIVQGQVPEILPALAIAKVAFLHIDLNCALPECAALEFFWDRLSPGAIVLLDDYAFFGHESQANSIDATARALGANVLSLPTGQGMMVR